MPGLLEELQEAVAELRREVVSLRELLTVSHWTGERCGLCGGMLVSSPAHPGAPGYCHRCKVVEHDGVRRGLIPGAMGLKR